MQITGTEVSAVVVATVTAVGGITSAWVQSRKKNNEGPKSSKFTGTGSHTMGGDVSIQSSDVSGANISIGNSVSQTFHGDIHNHIGQAPQTAGRFSGKVESRPSQREISEAVRSTKPYDAVQITKNYVGLRVSWPVLFESAEPRRAYDSTAPERWDLVFLPANGQLSPLVFVTVKIEECPKLRIIDRGHPTWIDGSIQEVSKLGSITLEDGAVIVFE